MKRFPLAMIWSFLPMCGIAQTSYVWQHTDVKQAWQSGYRGQGVTFTFTTSSLRAGCGPTSTVRSKPVTTST